MNSEPVSIKPGGRYRLFLQFEGGEAAADPRGVRSTYQIRADIDALFTEFAETQPQAQASYMDNVWIIQHLQPDNVTARVWVSEA